MLATLVAVALAGTALAGCGDDAPEAEPVELRRCKLGTTGYAFRTSLDTCKEAIAEGIELSVSAGLEPDADAPGAGVVFAALCEIIQDDERVVYDQDDGRALARQLHRSGVCPGELSNLKTAEEAAREAEEAERKAAERRRAERSANPDDEPDP